MFAIMFDLIQIFNFGESVFACYNPVRPWYKKLLNYAKFLSDNLILSRLPQNGCPYNCTSVSLRPRSQGGHLLTTWSLSLPGEMLMPAKSKISKICTVLQGGVKFDQLHFGGYNMVQGISVVWETVIEKR